MVLLAGVSALTFYGLLVVVGSIMFRSVQIVRGEQYDWGDLQVGLWGGRSRLEMRAQIDDVHSVGRCWAHVAL